jgi:hypothetical protein
MKKIFLTLSISVLLFCSCSNNETSDVQNSETKISAVLNEKNYESQKVMYQMLSAEDKFKIWQDKIDEAINNDDLNKNQIILLNEIKSKLLVIYFEDSKSDEKEIFKNVYLKNYLEKCQKEFEYNYFYKTFFTLNGKLPGDNFDDLDGDGNNPNCTCNQGSIWSCAGVSSDCKSSNKCTSTTDGCGFLTMFECNGRCYVR